MRFVGSFRVGDAAPVVLVEVLDGSAHVLDRFRSTALQAMGWDVKREDYGAVIRHGNIVHVATAFPAREHFGAVSQDYNAQSSLRGN